MALFNQVWEVWKDWRMSMKGNGARERLGQIEENVMCLTKIPGSLGISI